MTAVFNRKPIKVGDTLDGFSFYLRRGDEVITPTMLRSHLRTKHRELKYIFDTDISPDGLCTVLGLDVEQVRGIGEGVFNYDIKFSLPSERVKTYLEGTVTIYTGATRHED